MKLILPILFIPIFNLGFETVIAKSRGSMVTSDLQKFCLEAGGVPKVFVNGCTDSCELIKKIKEIDKDKLRCTASMTADCDCGPDKCLEKGNCIKNPENWT